MEMNMILTAAQAQELGEALLDASSAMKETKKEQSVVLLDNAAVAVPAGDLIDDWTAVAYVK
jgi:hypothetical protein